MSKRAVIAIDIQNEYFPGGRMPLVGIEQATANAARVIDAARAKGDTVIHVRHLSKAADAPIFAPGTPGIEINAAVAPAEGEKVITKNFVNSFRETDLKATLDAGGIDEVVIVGAMSHMCVEGATRAATDFGYKTVVVHDACATRDLEFEGKTVPASQVHDAVMAALAFGYAEMISTGDFLAR
ncbi:cysteine hydrolase family protein [Aminobacter sp. AP02]|uniref:cysteine hydrolase family protein n=1 Tax=Aminobacter sp. AP02 TaxID=2135737 RepID=UPI000D6B1079|nr:cysteine hydrolase family protein [Aminobacter sp. AP02]PWK76820.1 nicotinamidase-related amidase [Aminobacter sp. AP02]